MVGELLTMVKYDYPGTVLIGVKGFLLSMKCFLCSIISGKLSLLEHKDARWLEADELDCIKLLQTNIKVINLLQQ